MTSNVTYFPAVTWNHNFSYKSGHHPFLNKLTVKMKRDVLHKADPTVGSYRCADAGSLPLSCSNNQDSPVVAGNYYYDRFDADVSCSCGRPNVHLQVQTRRWYGPADRDARYPAYDNGG
jgi:hypothetical protein